MKRTECVGSLQGCGQSECEDRG